MMQTVLFERDSALVRYGSCSWYYKLLATHLAIGDLDVIKLWGLTSVLCNIMLMSQCQIW